MSNFEFLKVHSHALAALGATAEKIFPHDPISCVAKLRLLAEAMAKDVGNRLGIQLQQPTQAELLRAIDNRLGLDAQVRQMFHLLRIRGNEAAHQVDAAIGYREALESLKVAREVALWFHRTFGKEPNFKPGPFQLPDDPSQKLYELQKQIAALQAQLQSSASASGEHAAMAALLTQQAEQEKALAEQAQQERDIYERLAEEASQTIQALQAELKKSQAQTQDSTQQPSADTVNAWRTRSRKAASQVHMDEASTRLIIDQMLRDAGWKADTAHLRHSQGTRPQRGMNQAIAEWPLPGMQSADYVLFCGLTPMAVVEAKRMNQNVAGKIGQAERYARHFAEPEGVQPHDPIWSDGQDQHFHIPFTYSCNGRPYVKQHEASSGTWFRDLRQPSNLSKPLQGFHSPQGLQDLIQRDLDQAQQALAQEDHAYLGLRDYQLKAVHAVEAAIGNQQRSCLLAMATGTGKTRTIIGLIYRLLKAERFKRILFLVDRNALGTQSQEAFDDMKLEQNQTLSKIYNIAKMGDMTAQAEDRVQVATVQAMVQRIFASDCPPPIDTFDCIIVDEAHRGYNLDQEMTEGEIALRDQAQYLSTYRRVLDYFDAVKVGLTATPAKHTSDIFGAPIYTYSYREAVADDWLIDHEPPIRYETILAEKGIHLDKDSQVEVLDVKTGEITSETLEDQLHFDVAAFNKRVINDNFNRAICQQLAEDLDPFGDEKTMIFCATDVHADKVVSMLNAAFEAKYGDAYNQATVVKITGKSDNVDQLIRNYKREPLPKIAVTVDLLTTGIDVPSICNLVFIRCVRSRILYEQMKGRATRRCDSIGKTVFRIYDPVHLYATLQEVDTMQPLVKNPNVTLDQLLAELDDPRSYQAPGTHHADDVLAQASQKIMRVLRKAQKQAEKKPAVKQRLEQLQESWGVEPAKLHQHLTQLAKKDGVPAAVQFLKTHTQILPQLEQVQELMGSAYRPILNDDAVDHVVREQSWGTYTQPGDYLDSFNAFIREQLNKSVALSVVVSSPKDLTREQLREIKLLLDGAGYTEAALKSAWRNQSNQDIAAGIVAYIRRAALGEALLSFEERVNRAMQRIYAMQAWSDPQRKCLERIAKQLKHETVVDYDFLHRAFAADGGAKRLDRTLNGQLHAVIEQLGHTLWQQAA